jgi:hypothetical protein
MYQPLAERGFIMPKVKVLSIKQPYAQLAVMGAKLIETRPMRTNFRGELYIHASQDFHKGLMRLVGTYPFREYIKKMAHELPTGAIIGKVTVTDCVLIDQAFKQQLEERFQTADPHERAFGDYTDGRYAWHLSNAVMFDKPIPAKGQLGIWNYELEEEFDPDYIGPDETEIPEDQIEALARAQYAGKEHYATYDSHVGGFITGFKKCQEVIRG